ncbi:MAG: hypothetical protein IIC26_05660 [Chloroflexi bacterium]|nr:hypothetical protein [Chloroflexota bacterium]
MQMKAFVLALAVVAALLATAPGAHADVGVGVNLGKIDIDDKLSPGGRYNLPTLGVINTGDEPGDYEVVISYFADQEEERPPEDWFEFEPQRFFLEAGESQQVNIRIVLPRGADPDDYFALIEAHPIATGEGGVSIGVAAATKLTFTVKPSNLFAAWRLQVRNFFEDGAPWSYVIPASLLALFVLYLLRRYFRLQLRFERRR